MKKALYGLCLVVVLLALSGTCRKNAAVLDNQRVVASWMQVYLCTSIIGQEGFRSKQLNVDFDPIEAAERALCGTREIVKWEDGAVYYVNTNLCLWFSDEPSTNIALVRVIDSEQAEGQHISIGATFGLDRRISTNKCWADLNLVRRVVE